MRLLALLCLPSLFVALSWIMGKYYKHVETSSMQIIPDKFAPSHKLIVNNRT